MESTTPASDEVTQAEITPAAAVGSRLHPMALWRAFRRCRRTRPFWGSLILALGGYAVARPLLTSDFAFYSAVGTRGLMPIILGGGMIAAAVIAVLVPTQRYFPAVMAAMMSVAALPMANLGGWIIGTVLGIVGSGMVFGWTPFTDKQIAKSEEKSRARADRKAARAALRSGAHAS